MQTLRRTPLFDRHVAAGARLVPFAGWEMPVQYEGVIAEHLAVRRDAGVFDVSHMGEIEVEGPTARAVLQAALSNDVERLAPGDAQYTLLTTESGGIVDDLIVYRLDGHRYLLVVNASNRDAAFRWLKEREQRGSDVRDVSDAYALLAVQGPRALERLGLPPAKAFTWAMGDIDGIEVMISRTGYTGEEGVELMCMSEDEPVLWGAVLARGVTPCGLGARDTLRLEACYPLHGNDIGPQWDDLVRRASSNVFMNPAALQAACATDFAQIRMLLAWEEGADARKLVGVWALRLRKLAPFWPTVLEALPYNYAFLSSPVVDPAHRDDAHRAAGAVDELDVRGQQIVDAVLVDRVCVAAADLHYLVVATRLDGGEDLGCERAPQLGVAVFVHESHRQSS